MTRHDGFERELTAWMVDVATPSVPDYLDDIVRSTARSRQRPRWTFPERWLPMSLVDFPAPRPTRTPWRMVAVLAVLAAILAAFVVVSSGNLRRIPAPFGLAANGLMAYATVGDVYVVDPESGARRPIATGPEADHDPRWSPDGAKIAFLRDIQGIQQVVIVAVDGAGPSLVASRPIGTIDPDSFKWAPSGRELIVGAGMGSFGGLVLVDSRDGAATTLPVDFQGLEPFWRPPDGGELLFLSDGPAIGALSVYSVATRAVREVPLPPRTFHEIRPMGWTPDGRRAVVHVSTSLDQYETYLIDPETGAYDVLDVGFGHVSNGGDRVVGLRADGMNEVLCVIDIDGTGPCQIFDLPGSTPWGSHAEGLQWSPDDRWVVIQPGDDVRPVLLDARTGQTVTDADWITPGAESWQREAP